MPSTPRPAKPPTETHRTLVVLMFLVALLGTPFVLMYGSALFDVTRAVPSDNRPLPQWVTPAELRGSTRDGALIKVRVALDAGSSSNKSAIEHRLGDLAQVLEVSIGARQTQELFGTAGIRRLRDDMHAAANAYLEANELARVEAVVIQDLWYARP